MKILLATYSVTPNSGIPSFNRELCSLLNTENEIHLLVDENIKSYIGYTKIFSTYGKDIYNFQEFSKILQDLLSENYDVIINSNSYIMSLLSAYMHNKTCIISISHSLGTMDCDNAAFNQKYVDNIIALSCSCKNYIIKRFRIKNKEKIKVIFNSVAENPNAKLIREKKINTNKIRIVFAGGSAASKSPDIIIPIIHELCKTDLSFEFYWLGLTTPPLKKIQPYNDIRLILPKDKRIIVTGLIPQNQAAEIIASCNVFLAPSRREGFPMALLEAMRIGCIPIVSDFRIANQEIIENGINGYIIPHNNIQAFVDRLSDIISNHKNYNDIYNKSYETFIKELSFPIWKEKILSIISEKSNSNIKRLPLTPLSYKIKTLQFKILEKFNLIENNLIEVVPCAIKFYMYYKKINRYANNKK